MTQSRKTKSSEGPAPVVTHLDDGRDFSARSVIASLLLGQRRPELPAAQLVRITGVFGLAEGTVRVALSRMVAHGELESSGGRYALAGALLERHLRQEEARRPVLRPWDGTWRLAVLGAGGARRRTVTERAAVRKSLRRFRLAEWREGVWLRPDNLGEVMPTLPGCTWMSGGHFGAMADQGALAADLWDLENWAWVARRLVAGLADTPVESNLGGSFKMAAAVVRHIRDDPLLPDELLLPDWPGARLRASYERYQREFQEVLMRTLGALDRPPS